ncbi:hypothetical protein BDZ45DRAFT_765138, partial [Acephala macrosclerotiorum]
SIKHLDIVVHHYDNCIQRLPCEIHPGWWGSPTRRHRSRPRSIRGPRKGRFYHVKGAVSMGMDYETRPRYDFGKLRTYSSKEYVFQLPAEKLQSFEATSSAQKPPHDERVMMTSNPASLNPPALDRTTWVDEVLTKAKNL